MFLSYERSLQPDLVGAGIIVAIAGLVGSRDPGLSVIELAKSRSGLNDINDAIIHYEVDALAFAAARRG
jgi:hypothetical protein